MMNALIAHATTTVIQPAVSLTDDDELYSGYNDCPYVYDIKNLSQDEVYQEAIKSSYGKRPIVRISDSKFCIIMMINI